jgi:hypothetical protein
MLKQLPINMLWISGDLSRLARLSLISFLKHGFRVTLWSYEPEAHALCGASVRDAAEILPEGRDFDGSFAYLSSLFRYRVLADMGGTWSDMDIVALTDSPDIRAVPLVASEKRRPFRHKEPTATDESLTQITNCFMANPEPVAGDLWHRAAALVADLKPEDQTWENVGPHMLNRLMLEDPAHGVTILDPDVVDPISWWNVPSSFMEARDPPPSPFMHMYASIWAKRGVNADDAFPENSMAGRLWRSFGL